jgi:hypothetical protein
MRVLHENAKDKLPLGTKYLSPNEMEQWGWPDGTFMIDQSVTEAAIFFQVKKNNFFWDPVVAMQLLQ